MSAIADPAAVRAALLSFYDRHRRDLPWRRTQDPYAIWVSEIMLQQTQVETVRPRYAEFLRRYPNVNALAAAEESEVCEAWAGLGYYRRARHLHAAARQVRDELDGELPRDAGELRTLPGIGRYTAGAIASICFGEEAPVVDGNVARVLSRLLALGGPPRRNERQLWAVAGELVRGERPGDLNQALMELGATVCTPRQPLCASCPVATHCAALALGEPSRFPQPAPAAPRQVLRIAFAWLETSRGLWLAQRPLDGLWPGLWELPSESGRGAKKRLAERLGSRLDVRLAVVEHQLSHRDVVASVYRAATASRPRRRKTFAPFAEPLAAPLSGLARKAIAELWRRP